MAAILGDLIRCVDTQSYLGETVLNVYYYRITAVTGAEDGYLDILNTSWEGEVLDNVVKLQISNLLHTQREWRNLSNGVDLMVDATVVPGGRTESSSAPSFTSYGFMLARESLVTRNGYKRFGGIPDSFIDGNNYVGNAGLITAVESGLAADLMAGITILAEPVIVKRPIETPAGEYLYSSVGSAAFRGIGTQNTRKPGRGI